MNEQNVKKVYLCPECGEEILNREDPICENCGWFPDRSNDNDDMTEEMIRDAVFQWLDDEYDQGNTSLDVHDITDELQISFGKARAYKREWLKLKKQITNVKKKEEQLLEREQSLKDEIEKVRQVAARQQQYQQPQYQQPQQNPNNGNDHAFQMVIESYKERVGFLQEELRQSRTKIAELERELRSILQTPRQPDQKWEKVEDALMNKFIESTLNPTTQSSGNWVKDLVGGVGPYIPQIAQELRGLSQDMANRNNPSYDPYAGVPPPQNVTSLPPPPMPPQQRPSVQVPPTGLKQQTIQQQPSAQPAPTPAPAPAPAPQPEPTKTEPVTTEPLPTQTPPATAQEVQQAIQSTYPNVPTDITEMAIRCVETEAPQLQTLDEKFVATIDVLKIVAMLRDIGIGMKRVISGTVSIPAATDFLVKNYPQYATVLAESGYETWLQKGSYFSSHPIHGKDIEFLNRPDVRQAMEQIVAELRRRNSA